MEPSIYLFLASTVLGMNVIPFFMPPTWAVLAFFVTKYHLNLLAVVLIGASAATVGRMILAFAAQYFRRFLSKDSEDNYSSIGDYLNKHEHITLPLMITYAFIPIPSNHVFIAAGLAKVRIKLLASAFFIGRLISYTFWVQLSRRLADNLADIFTGYGSKVGSVVVEIAGLVFLYFIGKIACMTTI